MCILGHIDHGKSSLLEAIRDFKITSREAGGITQHIGAYQVEHQGKKITFLDTPGHEAFSAIRARGAKVADIAILVVAADEGVKPQTLEAYKCIQEAKIPFIVAINKIDKPQANPQKVKNELATNQIFVEGMGGDVPVVETSAKTKQGIEDLLEIILLLAEMQDLKADLNKPASGVIIESYLDSKRGPCATLLLKEGILKERDIVATSTTFGKIRIMEDFQGKRISEAYPSDPVVVIGFEEVPFVGDKFLQFDDLEKAREFVIKNSEKQAKVQRKIFVPEGKKALKLIIKGDVIGSLEAIEKVLAKIPQDEVAIMILKEGVGDISEEDVKLAESSLATIIGFRVKVLPEAERLAKQKGISILQYEVIYDLVEGVRKLIKEIIESEVIREDVGKLKVLVVFKTERPRQIIGGRVFEGEFQKGIEVEIVREEKIVGKAKILNIQKEKKDIEKGKVGDEIGLLVETNKKIKEGDILVGFVLKRKKAEL